jgi:glycosyltransferase involved in cell wall biosynthesis
MDHREIIFYLPGVPAPIGGFKVVYEHAQILREAGFSTAVVHVNPAIYEKVGFSLFFRKIYFLYRRFFDRWRNYPLQYGLEINYLNAYPNDEGADAIVIASWQIMNSFLQKNIFNVNKIIHLAQDYPGYMGPEDKIKTSWKLGKKYLGVSQHLVKSIQQEVTTLNPRTVEYIPAFSRNKRDTSSKSIVVDRLFCVVSSGKYKNQRNLIKLLNKLVSQIEVITFSREERPKHLSKSIKHLESPTDSVIEDMYRTSRYSLSYSEFEGFCLPAFEAMYHNCILLTTDCLGNQDYIDADKNCVLLNGRNVDQDFEKVVRVMEKSEKEKLNIQHNAGIATLKYLETYNHDYTVKKYLQMIEG